MIFASPLFDKKTTVRKSSKESDEAENHVAIFLGIPSMLSTCATMFFLIATMSWPAAVVFAVATILSLGAAFRASMKVEPTSDAKAAKI